MSEIRQRYLKSRSLSIIGCPFSGGQGRRGVDTGPNSLIDAGLISQLQELSWDVSFEGHQQFEDINSILESGEDKDIGTMKNPRSVSEVNKRVSEVVGKHAKEGRLPLTLGGDHSLALGTVTGSLSAHPNAALIWIDAHADINTPDTTPSGNLHGCPVSFLLGLKGTDVEPFSSWVPKKPVLKADSLVYIGLRDIDSGERKILKENGIKCFSMHEVDRYGIGKVVELALDHVNGGSSRERPIHLSFDVDALDPSVAPSTGTPVRGGLTFREGHYICEALYETGSLVAMDLMEVNPTLMADHAKQTIAIGCSLIRSALGETLL
ncbi:arginase [Ceraceosorus guamensis]|uniref:Arginase n=1 Tax=Ceraceosorus guamensis TaxID=1522189 RepID=A0A316W167_9BASI|nr:arginase [Ceraceosorus guamensis]PWN43647.1 arginase [Ceraceosorus guamensis]